MDTSNTHHRHSSKRDKYSRTHTNKPAHSRSRSRSRSLSKEKESKLINSHNICKYPPSDNSELRQILLEYFSSKLFDYPIDTQSLLREIQNQYKTIDGSQEAIASLSMDNILIEMEELRAIRMKKYSLGLRMADFIMGINMDKIMQLSREYYKDRPSKMPDYKSINEQASKDNPNQKLVLNQKEMSKKAEKEKFFKLINEPTAIRKIFLRKYEEMSQQINSSEKEAVEAFRSKVVNRIVFCENGTREKCFKTRELSSLGGPIKACDKVHFKKIIMPHTDENLGNCSYLDTCRHMEYCKFVHYKIDEIDEMGNASIHLNISKNKMTSNSLQIGTFGDVPSPQWINCDLRHFDFTILGKVGVVMLDPPWDIHMNLPYGTLKDKEMKNLRVDLLQDDGLIFLWVTGRAMELGRECLEIWGYRRVEEIVWIKTNQLQRIIRTGRTGHWLNHSKEHCLVGIKGNPKINKCIDCDIIVSEVRETSRKPDEVYTLIERMYPNSKRVELFARPHNRRQSWISLGNQLPGIYLEDQEILNNFKLKYPHIDLSEEKMKVLKNEEEKDQEKFLENIYFNHITRNRQNNQLAGAGAPNNNPSTTNNLEQPAKQN